MRTGKYCFTKKALAMLAYCYSSNFTCRIQAGIICVLLMRTSRCRASRTMAETEAQSSDRGTFPDQACRPTQQRTILFHKLNSTSALPLITTIVGANVIWNYLVILPDCQTLSRRDLFSQHVRGGFLPLIGDKDINLASPQNHRHPTFFSVKPSPDDDNYDKKKFAL